MPASAPGLFIFPTAATSVTLLPHEHVLKEKKETKESEHEEDERKVRHSPKKDKNNIIIINK